MANNFFNLNAYLLKYIDFTDEELTKFNNLCSINNYKRKDVIINYNDKNTSIFFILKGIIRSFVKTPEDNEKTINFRIENTTFTGFSFYNNYVAKSTVVCIEDCVIIEIPFVAIDYIFNVLKKGEKFERFVHEVHVKELMNYIIDSHTKDVFERYTDLNNTYPNIIQRVPQHILANYLGVSQEYFSRLKKTSLRNSSKVLKMVS
jgi:signal-transduction protein with cAMP-binding, CBS, and nucleotidyltransferase domain